MADEPAADELATDKPALDEPAFDEPWQAQAFAMAVRLSEAGHFTWPEWSRFFTAEIAAAEGRGETDTAARYYEHWLAALEKLVVAKGLGSAAELAALKRDWIEATLATPHGQPIELKRRPLD